MEIKRISVAGIPVDIVERHNLKTVIYDMLDNPGTKQIVFLSIWDLLKARHNKELRYCLETADLILPISKSIVNGARFLKKAIPHRYNPYSTLILFLTILEKRYRSLYLLGGRKPSLIESESNIRATFPSLQIVGRYTGYFSKNVEKDVLSAIFKANPSLVLLSDGFSQGIMWPYQHRNSFGSSIFVYYKDALAILSNRKKMIPPEVFAKGKEIWREILKNPLKIFFIIPFTWYIIILLVDKIKSK